MQYQHPTDRQEAKEAQHSYLLDITNNAYPPRPS